MDEKFARVFVCVVVTCTAVGFPMVTGNTGAHPGSPAYHQASPASAEVGHDDGLHVDFGYDPANLPAAAYTTTTMIRPGTTVIRFV